MPPVIKKEADILGIDVGSVSVSIGALNARGDIFHQVSASHH